MKFLLSIPFITVCAYVSAQTASDNAADTLKTSYLNEVVVSANKIEEQRRTVAQQISVVSLHSIRFFNAQTSADLLQNTGVVAMQRSQQGGGSPMLRGFEASRVLLMVDGVRMNNAIYRAGHLQNVITIDNNMLERAEVLFGPSSTVYGSDALGGVVHFYTRQPQLALNGGKPVSGNAFVRHSGANQEKTGHVDVNLAGKKFASLTSFTLSDFGDLTMGKKTNGALGEEYWVRRTYAERAADNSGDVLVTNSDPYVQKFSGYTQYDLLQKFLFKASDRVQHLINFQYSNSTDIPRYDRLTDVQGTGLRSAQWYYGPQKRLMASYQLRVSSLGKLADGLVATASYQDIEESRHDRRFNSNNLNHRTENIGVAALTIDLNKSIGSHKLRYGFDSQFNDLTSTALRENIATGVTTAVDTRYPDGTNQVNYWALYGTHSKELGSNLTLNDGLRIGGSSLKSTFIDKTFFPFPFDNIEQKNTYASGNLGLVYTPTSWKLSLMGSTGYRVPNIDDLAKVFESVVGSATTTGSLVVPNPDLKPEKTLNADIGVTRFFGSVARLEGVVFVTRFFDAIVTKPSTFNGQSTVTYNGFPATVLSSQNANRALIYGFSLTTRIDVSQSVAITAAYNYTHGDVINSGSPNTPLDHIPPIYGRVGITYTKGPLRAEGFSNFNGWKYLSRYSNSGEDNLQYATPQGMPSWYTFNLRASYDLNKALTLQAGIDNLLDLQYRAFASGINAPGRNAFGSLRFHF